MKEKIKIKKFDVATNIGARPHNEDKYAHFAPNIFLVADGMGGHIAGEIASQTLAEVCQDFVASRLPTKIDEALLKEAVELANEIILQKTIDDPKLDGMGTTATVFHFDENNATGYFAHVGDTRLYVFRRGNLIQCTQDHSLAWDLFVRGEITREEARLHPKRNVLTRAVGCDKTVQVDTGSFEIFPDDILLICSDGLTSVCSNELIVETFEIFLQHQSQESDKNLADLFVEKALALDSHDNITAVVIFFEADESNESNERNAATEIKENKEKEDESDTQIFKGSIF